MRAAVVGAGVMGRWHTHALRRLGEPVVAVVDPDGAAAARVASQSSRAFADLNAALAECAVDVVHVCAPLVAHAELVRTALAARCHVLVEKPLAPSAAETR